MSDTQGIATAWRVSPTEYTETREAPYAIPARPISVYVPMPDDMRLALDAYIPAARRASCRPLPSSRPITGASP